MDSVAETLIDVRLLPFCRRRLTGFFSSSSSSSNHAVAPRTVTITGPSEAKVNDTVSLECTTTNSNPVARITWVVDGREVRENGSRIATSPDGGWVSSSNLTTIIRDTRRNLTVLCQAVVADLAQRVAETKIISVVRKFSTKRRRFNKRTKQKNKNNHSHDSVRQIRRNRRASLACATEASAKAPSTS